MKPTFKLMQKNIIITGTSRGIGFELTKLFSEAGHRVLALSRNQKTVDALQLKNVKTFAFDIKNEENQNQLVKYVEENWNKVDVLIHNAGEFTKDDFPEISLERLKSVYETNVFGVYVLTQKLMPFMQKDSHVIAVSSMGGIQGSVKFPGLTAYSSSKAAVINLMEVLAEEYKETGPIFNALALGAVQTEMFEAAFPGAEASLKPLEMADYIYNFALNGSKVFNGKVLQVSNSTP